MGTQSNENFDFDIAPRAGTYQPISFWSMLPHQIKVLRDIPFVSYAIDS